MANPIGITDTDGGPTILEPAVLVTAPLRSEGIVAREAARVETTTVGSRLGRF